MFFYTYHYFLDKMILHIKIITTSVFWINVCKISGVVSFKIQPFSFPTTSIIGKRVITTCATTTGGKVDFKWLKNGKEIVKNSKINVRSFPELSNLIIDPVTDDDSGNYTCIATARGITERYTAVLEVLGKIVLTVINMLFSLLVIYYDLDILLKVLLKLP